MTLNFEDFTLDYVVKKVGLTKCAMVDDVAEYKISSEKLDALKLDSPTIFYHWCGDSKITGIIIRKYLDMTDVLFNYSIYSWTRRMSWQKLLFDAMAVIGINRYYPSINSISKSDVNDFVVKKLENVRI